MTEIKIRKLDDRFMLDASGHCNFAPAGSDIVCAGISALMMGLLTALQKMVNPPSRLYYEVNPVSGSAHIDVCGATVATQGAIDGFIIAIEEYAKLYKNYVSCKISSF